MSGNPGGQSLKFSHVATSMNDTLSCAFGEEKWLMAMERCIFMQYIIIFYLISPQGLKIQFIELSNNTIAIRLFL
jgi:hypothetical protein